MKRLIILLILLLLLVICTSCGSGHSVCDAYSAKQTNNSIIESDTIDSYQNIW